MWLIDEQRKANQSTRSLFDSYLEHRTQTTQLALDSANQAFRRRFACWAPAIVST